MAIYGGKQVVTATTGSASVDTVVLTGAGFSVKVNNLGGNNLYWTVDSPGGACPVPTVGGSNCYVSASVSAAQSITTRAGDFQFGAVVQVIAATPTIYEVELQSVRATS